MKRLCIFAVLAATAVTMIGCGSDVEPATTSGTTGGSGGSGTGTGGAGTGAGGSGQGGSGQGGFGQGGMGGIGQGGMGQGGGTTCLGCSDVLQGGDPNELCTGNGPPSSSDIFADFTQCLCIDSCPMECAAACQGGMPDQACQQCAGANCQGEVQACFQDGGMGMCSTCSEVLNGNGNPNDLCAQSQQIFTDLFSCVCMTGCSAQCGDNVCMGGQPSQACQGCIGQSCGAEVQACVAD